MKRAAGTSAGGSFHSLNNSCLFESGESTVFLDSFEAFHREIHNNGLQKLRDVNTTLLEVSLSADLARRVKLRRADAV